MVDKGDVIHSPFTGLLDRGGHPAGFSDRIGDDVFGIVVLAVRIASVGFREFIDIGTRIGERDFEAPAFCSGDRDGIRCRSRLVSLRGKK